VKNRLALAAHVPVAALMLVAIFAARGAQVPTPAVPHFSRLDVDRFAQVLPQPPPTGSLAAQADSEAMLQVQAWRTPDQAEWAKLVEQDDTFVLFHAGNLLGPKFTRSNLPRLAALVKAFHDDMTPLNDEIKKRYARPRPFALDARVHPCVTRPANSSYPSGHTFFAYADAAMLAEIFPSRRSELFERAHRIAWGRVIGGAHFPSDLEGGRQLAQAVMAAEFGNTAFCAAVRECRREAANIVPEESVSPPTQTR